MTITYLTSIPDGVFSFYAHINGTVECRLLSMRGNSNRTATVFCVLTNVPRVKEIFLSFTSEQWTAVAESKFLMEIHQVI